MVSRDLRGQIANSDTVAGSVTSAGVVSFLSTAGNLIAPGVTKRSDGYRLFNWQP